MRMAVIRFAHCGRSIWECPVVDLRLLIEALAEGRRPEIQGCSSFPVFTVVFQSAIANRQSTSVSFRNSKSAVGIQNLPVAMRKLLPSR